MLFSSNQTTTTQIYTLSLHDALPIWISSRLKPMNGRLRAARAPAASPGSSSRISPAASANRQADHRSEEHTSELQSHSDLVCRLLLEKKNGIAAQRAAMDGTAGTGER